jgi:alpha-beta hydrolase superfamily lysophospholipase/predicted GNAT family N-acyltransferase
LSVRVQTGDWATLGEAATRVRTEVFVREQGIPAALEIDGRDDACLHCVAWSDGEPVATGRLLPDGHIGRMAVLPAWRRQGLGGLILQALIDAAARRGDREVVLSAQAYVTGFYARHGFVAEGEPFEEAGIEHRQMRLRLYGGAPTASEARQGLREPPATGASGPRLSARIETMADGIGLHVQDWDGGGTRGVYLLHGLGEHVGRYDALARWFCARGWRVRGHDHAGHGRSGGRRGTLRDPRQLVAHARTMIDAFAAELGEPPLLLGHSMGGALAAELAVCEGVALRGLVLSSPALATGIGPAQRLLAAVLLRLAPNFAVRNGLDPEALSHDPAVVRAYLADPLVHDRISARLLDWLVSAGERARAQAAGLPVRTLLMVAGADRLVDPEGSRDFSRAAPEALLALRWYDGLFHEIFNEQEALRARVLADLGQWVSQLEG